MERSAEKRDEENQKKNKNAALKRIKACCTAVWLLSLNKQDEE